MASSQAEIARYSINSGMDNLVKAVIVGGLYPRIARIAMPKAQFERVQQGAVQKDVSQAIVTQECGPDVIHDSTKRRKSSCLISLEEYSYTPARYCSRRADTREGLWLISLKRKRPKCSCEMQRK
jgi:hypothetical protein